MSIKYDVIIVGGGHNALICANVLAKKNKKVLICEARETCGGLLTNDLTNFTPSFSNKVKSEIDNISVDHSSVSTIALSETGHHLKLTGNIYEDKKTLEQLAPEDVDRYFKLQKKLSLFSKTLGSFMHSSPPRILHKSFSDYFKLFKLGLNVRLMGRNSFNEFARMIGLNIADELEDNFKNTLLQGLISHDAITGSNLGPRSPGSLINLLFRMANHDNSLFGGIQQVKGGVNAVMKSLEENVIKRGVEIKTSSSVKRCIIENDQVKGIELDDGTSIHANTVISSADPKSTYLCLLGAEHLDTDFKRRIKHYRAKGRVSKLQLVLSKIPQFTNLESKDLSQRLVISPSIDYIEENFNYSKFENLSPEPILELSVPSVEDELLCHNGNHIMNVQIQYAPFNVKGGWENKKAECINNVLTTLEKYAPEIRSCILEQEFISPNDIEKNFNVSGGHWHHGEIQIDQLFMLRPIPGAAQYKTPVSGLYMCGAGTHPGGGMTGIPGKNAAHEVLKNI
ncbi:NAD(P)/FAD-dependent oxidoreductase [Pelagibacterales bacterium]|jgi:phytoene dehydrogenase-like protein|nr:NAD(P)/FAD-dependent oxidoreductase [Pelagibacterales bacterium]|tara:strand:+ start:591 stop:2120 length:1530 start_codon:yes stop_codon:yes gene_type:complete